MLVFQQNINFMQEQAQVDTKVGCIRIIRFPTRAPTHSLSLFAQ